ncbi:MAG: hypothetical protein QME42_05090 [bacterium]|nr:hypothetical protein [bacterium]
MSSTTLSPKQGLRVLDPDLPFLAAEVAIDVDNLLAGTSEDQTAMRCLADKLLQSTELDSDSGTTRSQMDLATRTVLGEAVSETVKKESLKKIEDLLAKANQIAKVLVSDNPQNNREGLEQARNFCVALSRSAAAYSESIRDLRPSHPFRR